MSSPAARATFKHTGSNRPRLFSPRLRLTQEGCTLPIPTDENRANAIVSERCQRMLLGSPSLVTAVSADGSEEVLFQNELSVSYYGDAAADKLLLLKRLPVATLFSLEGPEAMQASAGRDARVGGLSSQGHPCHVHGRRSPRKDLTPLAPSSLVCPKTGITDDSNHLCAGRSACAAHA